MYRKFIIVILILFTMVGIFLFSAGAEEENSKQTKEKVFLIRSAMDIDAKLWSAYANKNVEKIDEVIKEYKELIHRGEKLNWSEFIGSVYLTLGNAYHTKSQFIREREDELMAKAVECWDKALELNPDLKHAVEFNKKQYKFDKKYLPSFEEEYTNKAYDVWNEAKEREEKSEEVDLDKAFKDAVDLLKKVIQKSPDYESAYHVLGDIYFDRKMYDKAKEAYDKALELNPDDKYIHYSLANYYLSQNQPKKVIKEAEKILEINPDDVFAPDYIKKANQQLKSEDESQ